MKREELIDYLDMILSQNADGPPAGPRPQGTFLLDPAGDCLTGLRLVAPDGTIFYLAVFGADFLDRDKSPAPPSNPVGGGKGRG